MKEITSEQRELYNQLDTIRLKEEKIGRVINRTAGYTISAGLALSLSQCATSCSKYLGDEKATQIMVGNDLLRMNEMDLDSTNNRFEYGLNNNEFIKNNPQLATALEQAKKEALEAKVASDNLFEQFKSTPEFQSYQSANAKKDIESTIGLSMFLGSFIAPGLCAWGAHSLNGAVARRRERPIQKKLDEIKNAQ